MLRRSFRTAEGCTGNVVEMRLPQEQKEIEFGFGRTWLTFVTGSEERCLSPIPEGWTEYTEAELRSLWERAVVVRRT